MNDGTLGLSYNLFLVKYWTERKISPDIAQLTAYIDRMQFNSIVYVE